MIDAGQLVSMADVLRQQARVNGHVTAQVLGDRGTSYAALDAHASRVANGLIALEAKPGTRIGHLGKNSDYFAELLFGAAKARCVLTGVNWRLAAPEILFILKDAGVTVLFVDAEYYPLVEGLLPSLPSLRTVIALDGGHGKWKGYAAWRDSQSDTDPMLATDPKEDVLQLYTSGTTGHPKGVVLSHGAYLSLFEQGLKDGFVKWQPGDPNLVAMPYFHVAGTNWALLGFYQAATNIIVREVDPVAILDLIEQHKVQTSFFVPAVILFLVQASAMKPRDFSSLRLIAYGASPIAEELLLKAAKIFECGFLQFYGLTETNGAAVHLPPADHDPARGKLRAAGKPNAGIEIRVVGDDGKPVAQGEVGEVWIRGSSLMKGYWNRPDATAEAINSDGWFKSGDAGYLDKDGYLFIHDRVKDMIISGGENIYPAEVENALFSHPGVADVAVIGVPDERWGEAVKAVVVKTPGSDVTPEALIAHAKERIAAYKVPKSVDFIDALPRNPTGKILKRVLREPYWKGRDRAVS